MPADRLGAAEEARREDDRREDDRREGDRRDYPARPIVGLLAVVQRGERFLLVRRGRAPNRGFWGFPGGAQELGEGVVAGVQRELAEETGVTAGRPRILTALDAIDRDEADKVRHHYTLVAIHLLWEAGEGAAADDAEALGWFGPEDAAASDMLPDVAPLMRLALATR